MQVVVRHRRTLVQRLFSFPGKVTVEIQRIDGADAPPVEVPLDDAMVLVLSCGEHGEPLVAAAHFLDL
jgi:hypothetical protein